MVLFSCSSCILSETVRHSNFVMFPAYAEVSLLGEVLEFEILDTLEFTSERKRMSVVVRERGTGALQLLTKGADETVFPTLCSGMQSNAVSAFTIPTSFCSKLHKVGEGWYGVFGSLVS